MKNFWRILSYASPLGTSTAKYAILTLFYVIFSLVNITALIPLLDVLFDKVDTPELEISLIVPKFSLTIEYFKSIFYFYFNNIILEKGRMGALQFVCVVIVSSVFLSNIFRYLSAIVLIKLRVKVLRNMRNHIFQKVSELHLGYFTDQKKGDLISRMTVDIQEIQNSVTNSLKVLFKEPILVIGYFVILFSMSVKLTLFTILVLPISGVIISILAQKLKKKAVQSQESLGRILNMLDETLSGMRIVKAFNSESRINEKFRAEVKTNEKYSYSVLKKFEMASPISEFLGVLAVAAILLVGGSMVLNEQEGMDASKFIGFLFVFTQVLSPAKAISTSITNINKGLAASVRIFEIIDTETKIKEVSEPLSKHSLEEAIEYKSVSFSYGEEQVLSDINLKIRKGQIVALVGPSGGGKSTMADLLPRFYEPSLGEIIIDGIDIQSYKTHDLRSLMGIVTQESILFNDTVMNNIAFGLTDIDESKVIKAAKVANAHDFIMQTPKGYQTMIGERGSKLSGGQRQRLSIARAVFKDPDILILDEATSALDSESEKLVQEALVNLMKNRTSIVIAHRLSTIQNAGIIVVIEKGKIVETGTHVELSDKNGLYSRLLKMQSF
ncbi:MAG: subfamily B ATP-binding cassette protein MsbA [Cyclobacteriaceae bacterium]|jgi:subfamily B ATP-binding cassette protein MsbA